MTIKLLTILASIISSFNALPSNQARALDTWALRHFVNQSQCQSDWDGFAPTRQEVAVYQSACALMNDVDIAPSDVVTIQGLLPIDCYPPSLGECPDTKVAHITASNRTDRRLLAARP
jgi:hypothetical protein